ncbi:MFS transporter [Actinomadura sp. ATCC 31491]|uniref:MFS transporter n=1 Tax=Actinomadura luzonensis TaxID=2805427 RepID=A0ABT0FUC9_9ACTN|nr:MFS transporter [Actinomadura luzonensis]MCK2215952.1 MFS transporter [Actinomadura luzonensis]
MRSPNRWAMLSLGMAAQGAGCVFMYGLPFLLPTLQAELGLTLAQAGILVGAPSAGMLATLIAWGWVADRHGERLAMTAGLALATAFLTAAAFAAHPVALGVLFALAGASGAAANAASGRVVLGWFPRERRGVAMGWRQCAQPIGVAVAGVLAPLFTGVRGTLLAMAAICAVVTVAVGALVADPPRTAAARQARAASPYREPALWRVHGASMLLVVPQFATAAFALTYLVHARHWDVAGASALVAAAQFAGAGGRLACGRWSDAAGSRVRPMRRLALVNGAVMVLLAAAVATPWGTPLMIAALVVAMSGNGLAFTAVSELAGGAWAGRALGAQNTGQNLVAAVTPGVVGAIVAGPGFGPAFALAGVLALAAALVTPSERAPAPAYAA